MISKSLSELGSRLTRSFVSHLALVRPLSTLGAMTLAKGIHPPHCTSALDGLHMFVFRHGVLRNDSFVKPHEYPEPRPRLPGAKGVQAGRIAINTHPPSGSFFLFNSSCSWRVTIRRRYLTATRQNPSDHQPSSTTHSLADPSRSPPPLCTLEYLLWYHSRTSPASAYFIIRIDIGLCRVVGDWVPPVRALARGTTNGFAGGDPV